MFGLLRRVKTFFGKPQLRRASPSPEPPHDEARRRYDNGHDLYSTGRLDEALACLDSAIELDPDFVDAHFARGVVLKDLNRWSESLSSLDAAVALKPDFVGAHYGRGAVLRSLNRLDEALASCDRTLSLAPNFPDAHVGRAAVLKDLARLREALESSDRAIALDPKHAEAYSNRGVVLRELGRWQEALTSFDSALALNPAHAEAHNNRGLILQELGRLDEALSSFEQAVALKPDFVAAYDNLLYTMSFHEGWDPLEALRWAQRYGAMVASRAKPFREWRVADDEVLRIGFVSGDFIGHPVAFFLESMLSRMASQRVKLIAYATRTLEDEHTARIKPHFAAWNSIAGLSDEAAAGKIHADGIHILVDLAGHTAFNRLPVFAWKPAPVQASWLGYGATTGVAAIDYYVADAHTVPPEHASQYTEAIWRLKDSYLCLARPEAVEVAGLPALATGQVTFGSFNNLPKMTESVIALWSRILKAVPGSRLFLKAKQLREESVRAGVIAAYAAHGIASDRLLLQGHIPGRGSHLAAYNSVDIGLDPFPYNGVTTTFESLWMGVPVVALTGRCFVSRQGHGILTNAGLHDWIATDEDAYVALAAAHAGKLEHLASLRAGLRQQVEASPLFDAASFAGQLEDAFFAMWRNRDARP